MTGPGSSDLPGPPDAAVLEALDADAWAALLPLLRRALHDLDDADTTPRIQQLRAVPAGRLAGGRSRRDLSRLVAAGGPLWEVVRERLQQEEHPAAGWLLPLDDRITEEERSRFLPAALGFMVRCLRENPISPPGVPTYQEEESRRMFHDGRTIFLRNWPYVWQMGQADDSPIRGKIGVMAMVHAPGGQSSSTLGGWGLSISAFSREPDLAMATGATISVLLGDGGGSRNPGGRRVFRRGGGRTASTSDAGRTLLGRSGRFAARFEHRRGSKRR